MRSSPFTTRTCPSPPAASVISLVLGLAASLLVCLEIIVEPFARSALDTSGGTCGCDSGFTFNPHSAVHDLGRTLALHLLADALVHHRPAHHLARPRIIRNRPFLIQRV